MRKVKVHKSANKLSLWRFKPTLCLLPQDFVKSSFGAKATGPERPEIDADQSLSHNKATDLCLPPAAARRAHARLEEGAAGVTGYQGGGKLRASCTLP